MIHIGVDPGKQGGLAALPGGVGGLVHVCPMPVSGGEISAHAIGVWVWGLVLRDEGVIATVELVHAMPKQGVTSTFTFGKGYGIILGVLGALGVRVELVTPQRWKGQVLAGTTRDKDAAIAWARRAYPQVSLRATPRCTTDHDGMADALAIADFGRRTFK